MNDDVKVITAEDFNVLKDFIDKEILEVLKFASKKNLVPPTFHLFFMRLLKVYTSLTGDILERKKVKDLKVAALLHREKVYFEEIYEQIAQFLDGYTKELEDLTKSLQDE